MKDGKLARAWDACQGADFERLLGEVLDRRTDPWSAADAVLGDEPPA